jgi:hypothetical protein
MAYTNTFPDRKAATRLIIAVDGEGKNLPFPNDGYIHPDALIAERGWHSYTLLAASDDTGKSKTLVGPVDTRTARSDTLARNLGLSTRDCLDFLLGLPRDALVVGFYFSYDVVKIVADLPLPNLQELATGKRPGTADHPTIKNAAQYHAVIDKLSAKFHMPAKALISADFVSAEATVWDRYAIQYTPRKKLKITDLAAGRTYDKVNKRYVWNRQVIVWDVFGFFQKSFVSALQDAKGICPPEIIKRIKAMKDQRGDFANLPDDKIIAYCLEECYYLAKLVRDMLIHIEKLGLVLNGWDGSGAIARAWMRREKIKDFKSETNLPPEVALGGYFGGRFEVSELGRIGKCYSYDINSAYPAIATNLPCLAHGGFKQLQADDNGRVQYQPGRFGIYFAGSQTSGRFAPFPFRFDAVPDMMNTIKPKSVYYAHGGKRWVWQDEIRVAIKHFGSDAIPLYDGWVWEPTCNHKPFSMVPDLYADRAKLKALGDGAEKVIKLLINSIYGKTAQSIGWSIGRDGIPKPPPFQSFIWAGMITSGTRAMILDAIMQSDTVSIATDGILSRTPIPSLTLSKALGDWGDDIVTDTYLFQSGVYTMLNPSVKCKESEEHAGISPDPCQRIYKTRGFSAKEIPAQALIDAWDTGNSDCFTVSPENEATRFVPLRAGTIRNNPLDYIGQWVSSNHDVTISHNRRMPQYQLDGSGLPVETFGASFPSEPYTLPIDLESAPYVPKQTWEDVEAERMESGDYLEWEPEDTKSEPAIDPWA